MTYQELFQSVSTLQCWFWKDVSWIPARSIAQVPPLPAQTLAANPILHAHHLLLGVDVAVGVDGADGDFSCES